jgi:hypothetical protein
MEDRSINYFFIGTISFVGLVILIFLLSKGILAPNKETLINIFYMVISIIMVINFTIIKQEDDKKLYTILLVIIINIFNINQGISGCNYPLSKKMYIFIRSAIIISIVGGSLIYSLDNSFTDLLYTRKLDSNKGWGLGSDDDDQVVAKPNYCIDSDDEYYEENIKKLTKEEKASCNEYNRRKEISDKINA